MAKEKKVLRNVQRMREEPDIFRDPTIPYKRTIVKTKQNWAFELIRQGKTKILFEYLLIWGIILFVCGVVLYFTFKYLWGLLF